MQDSTAVLSQAGDPVTFKVENSDKGTVATEVTVQVSTDEAPVAKEYGGGVVHLQSVSFQFVELTRSSQLGHRIRRPTLAKSNALMPCMSQKSVSLTASWIACRIDGCAEVKGYGFIACEAFPEQDVFLLKSELPQGRYERSDAKRSVLFITFCCR